MTYPTRLLDENERLLLDEIPHWSRLAMPSVVVLVVIGATTAGFVLWTNAPTAFGIALGAVVALVVCYFGVNYLAWRSTNFVVTSRRVIYRSGLFHRSGREISLDAIGDVSYHQSIIERLLGKGSIRFGWNSERGDEVITDIRHPEQTQRTINRAAEALRNAGRRPETQAPEQETPDATLEDALAQLDRLRRRGIITETEYSSKRSELLERY